MPFAKVPSERKEEECIHAGDSLRVEQEYYSPLSFPGGCRKRSLCCMCLLCAMRCVAFVVALDVFSVLRKCSFILSLGHFGFLSILPFVF